MFDVNRSVLESRFFYTQQHFLYTQQHFFYTQQHFFYTQQHFFFKTHSLTQNASRHTLPFLKGEYEDYTLGYG